MGKAGQLVVFLALLWCAPVPSQGAEPAEHVSLVSLLANPHAYEGRLVRVEGFFDGTHHEDCRLFLSRGDFDYYLDRNSVYVMWEGCRDRSLAAPVQRRYVAVEGVFQADIGAGFGSFSAIRDVSRIEPLLSRSELQKTWQASWWLTLWPWLPLGILFVVVVSIGSYWIAQRAQRR